MLFGQDYEKISITIGNIHILEPNVFITDAIMSGTSLLLSFYLHKNKNTTEFHRYWFLFFFVYGISSFGGGLGHALFYYLGIPGKIVTWISGIITIYFVERAMIAVIKEEKLYSLLKRLAFSKILFVFAVFSLVCLTQPIVEKPSIGFLPVAINTMLGLILSAGILAYRFSKSIHSDFKYFYYGVLIMVPSAIIFLAKINPHPWFDKNDLSHVLLTIGIIYFYKGVQKTKDLVRLT
jgi:hypothetical protein